MSEATQALFAKAVFDVDAAVPECVTAWTGERPERRFAVYRNNVASGLIRALAARFPAAERIVGAPFFAGMAQAYVREHPPRSPLLFEYGDDFADFVARFEPVASVAYLPDVIRLETARTKAYHAADEDTLDPTAFKAYPPDQLPGLHLSLHSSASVIPSRHPVVSIWAMNVGDAAPEPIQEWSAEAALVIRPELTVMVHRLPIGGATFVDALRSGRSLGEAVAMAAAEEPAFDVAANLACVLQARLFTGCTT